MKILLVPIDDRPVTYTFPQLICKSAHVEPIVPPRSMMGSLTKAAQIEELFAFCENAVSKSAPDAAVICLDSLLYGGLITSRRTNDDFKTILERFERIKKWRQLAQSAGSKLVVYAQSSIMRISDNYDNTEEKEYWQNYGRELFEWSACLHRLSKSAADGEAKLIPGLLQSLESKIPEAIRKDYLDTRIRNFSINQTILRSLANKSSDKNKDNSVLDYLVFSQDDSGEFGLNVSEKERLMSEAQNLGLSDKVAAYAGADEVACTLIARAMIDNAVKKEGERARPVFAVAFSPRQTQSVASRYEGQKIGSTVEAQLKASGVKYSIDDLTSPTFTLVVHGPSERQGDHITLPGLPDLSQVDTRLAVESTLECLKEAQGDCIVVDVAYANGGDPLLVEALFEHPDALKKIKSYAGWNTTGNTMGSAIALAIATWYSRLNEGTSEAITVQQKQCLFTRLLDDWAYQAKVRKILHGETSTQKLAEQISPYVKTISAAINIEPRVRLSFPWKRTFEIEIGFEGN